MKGTMLAVSMAVLFWAAFPPATEAKEPAAKPCTKIEEPCKELTFKGSPVLSRNLFMFAPFYSEEIITTTEGVTKITTFLTFIRVESEEPKSGGK